MSDYTPRGLDKLARQLADHPELIRCPRDSVVMRVLSTRAERAGAHGVRHESFVGRPKGSAWQVVEIDVECPACRRRAMAVRPAAPHAEPETTLA
jgi:hypothetical protein